MQAGWQVEEGKKVRQAGRLRKTGRQTSSLRNREGGRLTFRLV